MFFWWGPGWGWLAGLISAGLWILLIVGAIVLLRRELPDLQQRFSRPPALRVLEERYAKGEITRDEFLHRREVLSSANDPTHPAPSYQVPPQKPSRSAPPPSSEPPPAEPPQAPSTDVEPAVEALPETDHEDGAMSSTWEPPTRAASSPRSSAEPTQPLPSAEPPE